MTNSPFVPSQLGHGDLMTRGSPTKIAMGNVLVAQIAAGSNHSVLLSSAGQVG